MAVAVAGRAEPTEQAEPAEQARQEDTAVAAAGQAGRAGPEDAAVADTPEPKPLARGVEGAAPPKTCTLPGSYCEKKML